MEKVNLDIILNWLIDAVENKKVISPSMWVNTAQKITILLHDEHNKLFELQQKKAIKQMEFIESGLSVAHAKVKLETTEEYKEWKKQEAKIELVIEQIRLSKLQAKLKDDEFKSY